MEMSDLLLKHQYTDREGHDIYNIVDPNNDEVILGSVRMKYGKDDGYRGSGVRIEWAANIADPDVTVPTGSQ